ncbi:MAG: DUF4295 family protein [Fidelibacterota bacterium]
MAKKQSFAEKAKKGQQKGPNYSMVKYVKSVKSEKTGQYRFQETMLKIPEGMTITSYLQQIEDEAQAMELVVEEPTHDNVMEEASEEPSVEEEATADANVAAMSTEESSVEESIEETPEDPDTTSSDESKEDSQDSTAIDETENQMDKSAEEVSAEPEKGKTAEA